MSDPIAGGSLVAIPYRGLEAGVAVNNAIIDHMIKHPQWFAAGMTEDEVRLNVVWMLNDSSWFKWEIWSGGTFAGMLLLSGITPKVDAVFHFTLLPSTQTKVSLIGARRLIWGFLGHAFEAFQLQRISVEIPDNNSKLANFFRQKLHFKYEGQDRVDPSKDHRGVTILDKAGYPSWVAYQGSRRERAHWDGTKWTDLVLFRLLAKEYESLTSPLAGRENPSPESPDVTTHDGGTVRRG